MIGARRGGGSAGRSGIFCLSARGWLESLTVTFGWTRRYQGTYSAVSVDVDDDGEICCSCVCSVHCVVDSEELRTWGERVMERSFSNSDASNCSDFRMNAVEKVRRDGRAGGGNEAVGMAVRLFKNEDWQPLHAHELGYKARRSAMVKE
jgi:hypothetical protein